LGFIPANRGFFSSELAAKMRAETIVALEAQGIEVVAPNDEQTNVGCVESRQEAELLADLFECPRNPVVEAVAKCKDPSLTGREPVDRLPQRVGDVEFLGHLDGVDCVLVLDEVTELSTVFAYRLFEGDRVGNRKCEFDLCHLNTGLLCDLFGLGITSELSLQRGLGGTNRCERVVKMHRDTNRS